MVVRRDVSEERAIEAVSALRRSTIEPLVDSLAIEAADGAIEVEPWPTRSASRRRRGTMRRS